MRNDKLEMRNLKSEQLEMSSEQLWCLVALFEIDTLEER